MARLWFGVALQLRISAWAVSWRGHEHGAADVTTSRAGAAHMELTSRRCIPRPQRSFKLPRFAACRPKNNQPNLTPPHVLCKSSGV
jgi:hypothetical protein